MHVEARAVQYKPSRLDGKWIQYAYFVRLRVIDLAAGKSVITPLICQRGKLAPWLKMIDRLIRRNPASRVGANVIVSGLQVFQTSVPEILLPELFASWIRSRLQKRCAGFSYVPIKAYGLFLRRYRYHSFTPCISAKKSHLGQN